MGVIVSTGLILVSVLMSLSNALAAPIPPVSLSRQEKDWLLKNQDHIELWFEKKFPPIEFADQNGKFTGMGADFLALIEEKLDVRFGHQHPMEWTKILSGLENGQCAIAPTIVKTDQREEYTFFTAVYAQVPIVIIGTRDSGSGLSLNDLKGQKIAVVDAYATEQYLRNHLGAEAEIITVEDVPKGLQSVAFGQTDAFLVNLAVASYHIRKLGITNLKVSGITDYRLEFCIGVSKKHPLLFSAIQKAMSAISREESADIRDRWITLEIDNGISPDALRFLIFIGLLIGGLVIGLLIISLILKHALNEKITRLEQARHKVAQTEARFQTLFDLIPFSCVITDMEGRHLLANQYFCKSAQKSLNEIIGSTMEDLGRSVDMEQKKKISQEIIDKGFVSGVETIVNINGSKSEILFSSCLIDWEGKTAILSSTVDITDRNKAEAALKESQERLSLALDAVNDGLWDFDIKSGQLYLSDNYYKMLGHRPGDFAGNLDSWLAKLHPDDQIPARDRFFDYLEGRTKGYESEFRMQTRQGEYKWILSRGRIVKRDENGKPVRIVGTHMDLTEKKLAQTALMESRENLRVTLNSIGDAVIATDINGIVTRINPVAQKLTGWQREEAVGTHLDSVFHIVNAQTMEKLENPVQKVLSTGKIVGLANHTLLIARDGRQYQISDAGSPIRNDGGDIIGVVLVFRDVTGEYDMEQRLRQAQKMEAIGVLAGGIAHDFNNILSAVMGFTDLAKLETGDNEILENYLDSISSAGLRARDLVKHILTFSRKTNIKRESIYLDPVIKETLKFIRASFPANIEIRQRLKIKHASILGDATQMHQILMNLFTNAGYAMKDGGGRLEVRLDRKQIAAPDISRFKNLRPGLYIHLTVSDTGTGISKENINRIFEPFFTTKKREEGTGMGLSTVYGIVNEMGGSISVKSEVGVGTTFEILIPEQQKEDTKQIDLSTDLKTGDATILLVDDEPPIVKSIQGILSSLGYTVTGTTDCEDALSKIKNDPACFDLVITDMTMPGMNGLDLSKKIKAIRPDLPIILCTGFSQGLAKKMYQSAGVLDLVMKPMIASELSMAVYKALHKKEKGPVL